jgi:hypothetical protein
MSLKNESELTSLVPAMDRAVGASTIGDTISVKGDTVELGLVKVWTKSSIFKKFL